MKGILHYSLTNGQWRSYETKYIHSNSQTGIVFEAIMIAFQKVVRKELNSEEDGGQRGAK